MIRLNSTLFATVILLSVNFNLLAQDDDETENPGKEIYQYRDYSFIEDIHSKKINPFESPAPAHRIRNFKDNDKTQSSPFINVSFFGPFNSSGRTRALLPDLTDPQIIFAGQTSGGLFRSTNAGQTWTPINDQNIGNNLTCIDQNHFNPDIIYYGTGEHKNRKIESHGTGVYKSTDHGLTFANIPVTNVPAFELINDIKCSLTDSNTIYVATTDNGLYKSTDGGASYTTVFNNGEKVTDIEVFTSGKVMICSSYDGIYYSPTGDVGTWTKSTGLLTSGFSRIEMAYCDSFPNIMYCTISDSVVTLGSALLGCWKSTDGGVTWNAVTNPVNIGFYPYADYMMEIVVKPDDPNYVVSGGAQGAWTTDGGVTWTHLAYPKFDQHAYVFSKFNNNLLYTGTDQGVTSFDVSQQPPPYIDLNYSYNVSQIWGGSYFPTGKNFLLGIQDNVFQKNSNNDSLFVRMPSYGSDGNSVHVNQQNTNVTYLSGNFAELLKSTNSLDSLPTYTHMLNDLDLNGDNAVDDDVWHVNAFEMNYKDGEQMYLPTRDHIWRSINGGDNWTQITNSFSGGLDHPFSLGISNAVHPVIYSGGSHGFFIRIDSAYYAAAGQEVDLSASVPAEVAGGIISCLKVQPTNDNLVYATVSNADSVSRIWKISQGNTNNPVWTDINANFDRTLNVYWIEVDRDHPDSVLFVGTDYGLYVSSDAGTSWSRETDVPLITIFQMRYRRSDRQLFVYTFGRGVWICSMDPISTTDIPVFDSGANGIKVFPNPTKGIFTLLADTKKNEHLNFQLTDLTGRIVLSKELNTLSGQVNTEFDLSGFSDGIYFLTVKGENKTASLKIIKY